MIHSAVSLIKYLSKEYTVYILAHKDAYVFTMGLNAKHLILENPWSISANSPIKTIKTYIEVKNLLKHFDKKNTLVFTNNVGSELIFSGFGFLPIPLKRVFISRGGDYNGKTGFILKRGFKSVSNFVAISNRQKRQLIKKGIPDKKISIIHNGVDNLGYSHTLFKRDIVNISIVGYIDEYKNQILAIRTLAQLISSNFNVQLNLYGIAFTDLNKIYESKLKGEIEVLGIGEKVHFKGFVNDKKEIYKNTDILVSCSLSEGFGRTIAEAMSCGIPCIGLEESGGILDIITNNFDGVIIKNNTQELHDAIAKLITDSEYRDKLSKNAISTYSNKFTEKIMCVNYRNFLNQHFN